MYLYNKKIFMEDKDQCNKCEYINKGVACPLIQALQEGVVCIPDDITMNVTGCGFYVEYERPLKIVKDKEKD